jgi:mannonate dehydratase
LGTAERDGDIAFIQRLVRSMGAAGVPVLCYNFMSTGDMTRTRYAAADRGGALVNRFDLAEYEQSQPTANSDAAISEEAMWNNLKYFLDRIVPVAEQAGVKLAMHPDDPPGLPQLHGQPRIMGSIEQFERLVQLVPNPVNGICFCQGCFSEMGVDVPAAIRRLAGHIHYVHFRDVKGCTPSFHETFHDCGQTDMPAAMRAYRDIGFDGVMRPDHVPVLEGETGDASGYTMLGRLFAVGYMRGLMQAVASEAVGNHFQLRN